MGWLSILSLVLLLVIVAWTLYHLPILVVGWRRRDGLVARPMAGAVGFPRVSVVVPVKNEARVIGRCLASLLEVAYPRDRLEVVVVEDGSSDGSLPVCQEVAARSDGVIRVVSRPESRGKPDALNYALQFVTGEIVGVLDADSVVPPDLLVRVAETFQDEGVVAVQGATGSLDAGENWLTRLVALEEAAWFQGLLRGREALGLFVPLTGSCMFVRRKTLDMVGGWRVAALAEDVELAAELAVRGVRVRFDPRVQCWQETPSRWGWLVGQRLRWFRGYMEAAFRFGRLVRHPSRLTLDAEVVLAGPLVMLGCLASYVLWGLTLVFPGLVGAGGLDVGWVAVGLTALTLFSVGVALVGYGRIGGMKRLLWIPFVYAYWGLQTVIAGAALLQLVFRRPRVWRRTSKSGSTARLPRS